MLKWLDDHFEEFLMVIFLIAIACVMMLQVVVRKIPDVKPLTWAEEFSRFMWIMSVFVSLPYTVRKSNMLRVNVIIDLLPQYCRKVINIAVDIIVGLSMGLLAYHSVECLKWAYDSGEPSPAMEWPVWILYAFVLLGFALATLRSIQMVIIHLNNLDVNELTTLQQTMEDAKAEVEAGKRAEGAE